MARIGMDMGKHDGVKVDMSIDEGSIVAGTNTVPGTLSLKNENLHPVIELECQIDSKLNIMPSNFSFKKINPGDTKTVHLVVNVPESTEPGSYKIMINLDFKIDTPPVVTPALTITVTKTPE